MAVRLMTTTTAYENTVPAKLTPLVSAYEIAEQAEMLLNGVHTGFGTRIALESLRSGMVYIYEKIEDPT